MKLFLRVILVLCFITCVFLTSNTHAQNIKTGLWKITTTMEMPGMPSNMQNKFTTTHTQCLSDENPFPQPEEGTMMGTGDSECKVVKSDTDGNKVSWVVECTEGSKKTVIKGNITYNGDTFEGQTIIEQPEMKMVTHMKGERIGDCNE